MLQKGEWAFEVPSIWCNLLPWAAFAAHVAVAPGTSAAATAGSAGFKGLGAAGVLLVAEWGRQQLLRLLGHVMIRSCKADLALLPPCYKKVSIWKKGIATARCTSSFAVFAANIAVAPGTRPAAVAHLLLPLYTL
jgi:hypothetical protein